MAAGPGAANPVEVQVEKLIEVAAEDQSNEDLVQDFKDKAATEDDHQSQDLSDMEPIPAATKASSPIKRDQAPDRSSKPAFAFNLRGNYMRSKGSSKATNAMRQVKYPFAWAYNKVVGFKAVDEYKIRFQFLPKLYVIPFDSQHDILPMVKKHAFQLIDGRWLIAGQDMNECRDSRKWYRQEKTQIKEHLVLLRFNKDVYEEIDALSEREFGRFLKQLWESGKLKATEEITFQKKIRDEL